MIPIHLKCPHCDNVNTIYVQGVAWFIIETCRTCQEWNLIFMGAMLPLEKYIMDDGAADEKTNHLLEVIAEALKVLIRRMAPSQEE